MLRQNNDIQEMLADLNEDLIPHECFCPITREVMEDPVTTQDGHSYERKAIESWFRGGHKTSPKTNERLASTQLFSNHALRNLIQETISRLASVEERERSYNWLGFFQYKSHGGKEKNKSLKNNQNFSRKVKCLVM